MEKQLKAERERRAAILTAEGQKQAAILTAEGAKQSVVLAAEGEAQAAVLRADGAAKARVISAEAEAVAVMKIYEGLRSADPQPNELAHRYLQALPEVAKGDANKVWIIPAELSGALARIKDGLSGQAP
jgi:regulator of protease activity HflC (stomatin/prohibitin superfamily)